MGNLFASSVGICTHFITKASRGVDWKKSRFIVVLLLICVIYFKAISHQSLNNQYNNQEMLRYIQ